MPEASEGKPPFDPGETVAVRLAGGNLIYCVYRNPGRCRSCGAVVLWVETQGGKRMPVDYPPDESSLVESHFATCPQAKEWRRG